ncbi:MAG: cupin domain-containing protein [Actinomycetota bacterium]
MRSLAVNRESARPHPRPEWFSGQVWIQALAETDRATDLEIFAVFFDAGARTMPHTHSTEQLLSFVEGEGVVDVEGERRRYRPGGMAVIPANTWHWHGATPTTPMTHLSIRPGGPTVWAPEVPMREWDTYMLGIVDDT